MKSHRRNFLQTPGTSSAGVTIGAAALATAPEQATAANSVTAKTQYSQQQLLLAGDNIVVRHTQYGRVRGYVPRGIHYFLGMPYEADTSVVNRFMPPQKPKPWNDAYPALWCGNSAPQNMDNRFARKFASS